MVLNILKVFGLSAVGFIIAVLLTPVLSGFLYRHKLWKKKVRQFASDGAPAEIFGQLHKEKEIGTPRMGGVLIWAVALFITIILWALARFSDFALWDKLNYLSRSQTWLPVFTLVGASLIGLADDIYQVLDFGSYIGGGIRLWKRLALVVLIAGVGAWWFYIKLGVTTVFIPGWGEIFLGSWFIVLFIITMLATFSGGVIDGLDGLSGGVFAAIFSAYAGIAFFQNQIDLAAFLSVVVGTILAFLWFNIPPARFYMGETGILGLTSTLTIAAFLTDSVAVLPIIALPLVLESASVIIQLSSKKLFKRKVFKVAPLHHHFEAMGWPSYKVTMRFWVVSVVCAVIGMVVALVGK